jgi:hypothetical protein
MDHLIRTEPNLYFSPLLLAPGQIAELGITGQKKFPVRTRATFLFLHFGCSPPPPRPELWAP